MVWNPDIPEGNESGKIRHRVVPFVRGKGLDLGCGPWPVWPHVIGVDNYDEWDSGDPWRPDVVSDVTDLTFFKDLSMDYVFSSHLLEHIEDTEATLREWWRVLKVGGYLVLYLPHKSFYPNIGEPGHNPDHKHDFLPADIIDAMRKVGGWDLVVNEDRNGGDEYSFVQVFKKMKGTRESHSWETPRPKKKLLLIRYGAIGDMIQISSVLPGLKAQGWHITLNTTVHGQEILKNDPNIDDWWIQDKDMVPQEHLTEYWKSISKEFDHTINLSESVEGALLAIPGRRTYSMSKAARHMAMDINYQEFIHALADVPPPYLQRFHASPMEVKRAQAWRAKHAGRSPLIMWALAGSSVHKVWPWLDAAVDRVIERTGAHIVFVGDAASQPLELAVLQTLALNHLNIGYEESDALGADALVRKIADRFWGGQSRLHCLSGRNGVRESLALAQQSTMVIGPETGMLNAVAHESNVRKIVMLSHSSEHNLTRHWENTVAIVPDVSCYPCHRMHYDRSHCPTDKSTGAAICAASINYQRVLDEIMLGVMDSEAA